VAPAGGGCPAGCWANAVPVMKSAKTLAHAHPGLFILEIIFINAILLFKIWRLGTVP
jgi:hypothetical protein